MRKLLTLFTALLFVGSMWGTDFSHTYSYGGTDWERSGFSNEGDYYKSNSSTDCVATIPGIFTDKEITSSVVITLNVACYGNGSNPTSSKFSIYTSSACSSQVTATQGGTLPTNSDYKNTTYTITQTNAGSFTDDLAIKVASGTKLIRLKSIKVAFSYTPAVVKKNTSLELSSHSLDLSYGGSTSTLTATVTPEGESALASPTVTWKSDNTSVATVSDGVVSPVAEGTCKIIALYAGDSQYNGSTDTATVTVTDTRTAVISAISKIWPQLTLYVGRTAAFTPVVTLADGIEEDDVTYSYVSADPTTIRINNDGSYTVLKTSTKNDIDITVTATPVAGKLATHKPVSATFQHGGAYRYKKPVFTPTGVTEGNFTGSMTLEMANDGTPVGPIYYTTDGTEPAVDKSNCTLYESALTLTATTTVKARVIDSISQYSTVTTATYTRVAAEKNAISLGKGASLSFSDFKALGDYGTNKEVYVIASDGDKYKYTSTNVGNYSGTLMQIQNNNSAYTTLSPVTAPNGFRMTLTVASGSAIVKVGDQTQTAVSGTTFEFKTDTATAVTIKRNSGTTTISNITFYGFKDFRSVTFPDGDQVMTYGGSNITKVATVSDEGTATYSSSNTAVATVDASTGEVTAVKSGNAVITATVAADAGHEESKGSYKVTVNKAASTLAFNNDEETVELVDATATFTATLSPADDRSVTYSSDDITVNSSTGAVTLTETGDYTIKANAAANDRYDAPSEASYTLHVVDNRVPVVSNLNLVLTDVLDANIDLDAVQKGDVGFLSATYTKAGGFSGEEVVSFATSDASILKIENGNEFTALKGGDIKVTVTVTSNGNKMFTTVSKEFDVTVTNPSKTATEITIEDSKELYVDGDELNLTYGSDTALTVTITTGYEGTIETLFANSQIAELSVSGTTYTITPLAVGSTTLKFSAAETANYEAAEDITLTINVASNVTAQTTTPESEDEYYIDQQNMKTVHTGWTTDEDDVWSFDASYGAVTATSKTSGTYDLVSQDYDLTHWTAVVFTFEHTGQTFSTPSNACNVYVQEGSNAAEKLTIGTYFSGNNWTWKEAGNIEVPSKYNGKTVHFIFRYTPTSNDHGKWEIRNFKVWGILGPYEEVTLNADGYATYCSQYPLDFSDYKTAGYSAYQATSVSTTKITFKQITGKIKGGQGILLKGTENETVEIYNALSSDAVLSTNKLVGCMVPTYLAASTQDYVLNGDAFELANSVGGETIGANEAYLHLAAPLAGTPASLEIDIEDTPTAIDNTEVGGKAVKVLRNGVLYIEKNGRTYNAQGQLVK